MAVVNSFSKYFDRDRASGAKPVHLRATISISRHSTPGWLSPFLRIWRILLAELPKAGFDKLTSLSFVFGKAMLAGAGVAATPGIERRRTPFYPFLLRPVDRGYDQAMGGTSETLATVRHAGGRDRAAT